MLDRKQVLALEPSLAQVGHKIAGGIYCPTDETGDCNKFTTALVGSRFKLVDRADISTLHSFCKKLLQRYFHAAGTDPNSRGADDASAVASGGTAGRVV